MTVLGMNFDIGAGVTPTDIDQIETGFEIAQEFLDLFLGGGIAADITSQITVKIEATGLGNQEPGGGGGVATAFSTSTPLPRPYFDVANAQWSQDTTGRGWTVAADNMKTVVHEYVHGWQGTLGAMTIYEQPLGNWINEGIAEYLAYKAMVWAGHMSAADADIFVYNGAVYSQEFDAPLSSFQTTQTPLWVGHVGAVAIDWLVSESKNGLLSLRILAEEIAGGASVADAFRTAFHIELAAFYAQFEAWRTDVLADSNLAFDNRPALLNLTESITGTSGDDTLTGTSTQDLIQAGSGNDHVQGLGGNDQIVGGDGADLIEAGAGNDQIWAGAGDTGADTVLGGLGDDIVGGGGGNDSLSGESGADTLFGGAGDDWMSGGNDADLAWGGNGSDIVHGGSGADVLGGGAGNDALLGDGGNDILYGGAGDDTLAGGTNNDTLFGGEGSDTVSGQDGDDLLYNGSGNDSVAGGTGNDTIWGGAGNDTLGGESGLDLFAFAPGNDHDTIIDFELDEDRLDLSAFDFADEAAVTAAMAQVGADLVLTLSPTQTVTIENWTLADFQGANGWVIL